MLFPSAENALYDPSIIAEPKRKDSALLLLATNCSQLVYIGHGAIRELIEHLSCSRYDSHPVFLPTGKVVPAESAIVEVA